MNQVKTAFIKEVLSRHGQQLQHKIIASMSSEGISSPSVGISSHLMESEGSVVFRMTLPVLRRFQDMGAPLQRGLTAENIFSNKALYSKKRSKKPIYNRNVWGHMNSLSRELMFGLTQETVRTIKSQFNQ